MNCSLHRKFTHVYTINQENSIFLQQKQSHEKCHPPAVGDPMSSFPPTENGKPRHLAALFRTFGDARVLHQFTEDAGDVAFLSTWVFASKESVFF